MCLIEHIVCKNCNVTYIHTFIDVVRVAFFFSSSSILFLLKKKNLESRLVCLVVGLVCWEKKWYICVVRKWSLDFQRVSFSLYPNGCGFQWLQKALLSWLCNVFFSTRHKYFCLYILIRFTCDHFFEWYYLCNLYRCLNYGICRLLWMELLTCTAW